MKLINSHKRFSVIDVDPDDLAAQLTLIDLPIFKSIQMDELILSSHGASRRNLNSCPNIAAMKRQFNQVTFWVVGQILAHDSPRQRAELISHLIKTARSLYQLNNLHSSNALVSALLSSPIYRLDKTWHYVNKKFAKEKTQFDRLRELYSDTNNYESLRSHLASCSLPCIPYLGMYSRDIIYINEAHQEGTLQRTKSTSKILESIEKFQSSSYDHLVYMPEIHCCLLSSRYIDELQRFVEDENYRRSLELEPSENNCLNNHHHHNINFHSLIIDHNSSLDSSSSSSSPRLHQSSSSSSLTNRNNVNQHNHHKRSTNVLAGLTSMVHSAVALKFATSNHSSPSAAATAAALKLGESSSCAVNTPRSLKYLIDDSFIRHHHNGSVEADNGASQYTILPPPISTSS